MAECYDNRQSVDEANTMSDEETSDEYFSFEASSSDETSEDRHDLERHQIREYEIVERGHAPTEINVDPKGAKCDNKECIISFSGNFALYLCYVCNLLLCRECLLKHDKTHEFVRVESETDERRRMAEMFVGRMRSERLGRGKDFDREDVRVHGRVNVKHDLDKEKFCILSGFAGLENKRWVAVDQSNYCIKIFCSVSNTLLRYIKFGGTPWDATEIKVKQKSTDPNSASGSKTDISGAARDEPDKQSLLAVTLHTRKQIWFIDVNKTPAVKTKAIKTDYNCYSIDFSEDKILTLCQENILSVCSICILSTDGNLLKVIKTPGLSIAFRADLAVHNGKVYLCNHDNDKVLGINLEDGKITSEFTDLLLLKGISVDYNTGVLYVCNKNKVYKLSPDLGEYEPLSLDTDYTQELFKLCFINNKLYFSHNLSSYLCNGVTVVQLLT